MKNLLFFLAVLFTSCDDVIKDSYTLVMPELPAVWQAALGGCLWHVEWIDMYGAEKSAEIKQDETLEIKLIAGSSSPVLAQPYWPEKGVKLGEMKGAGALFPWDCKGSVIALSWQGGVDAVFWREISRASGKAASDFDWKRWRELWKDSAFPAEVTADPWVCDWEAIGAKTAASGFDKRRIIAVKLVSLIIDLNLDYDSEWFGPSPFDEGTFANPETPLRLPLRRPVSIAISENGILHYSKDGFVLTHK